MQNTISGNLHTEPNIDKPTPEAAKTQVKILLSEDSILEKANEASQSPKYLQKQAVDFVYYNVLLKQYT